MSVRVVAPLALGCALMSTLFGLVSPGETQAEIPAGARCVYTEALVPGSCTSRSRPRLRVDLPIEGPTLASTGACSLSQSRSRGSAPPSIEESD